MMGLGLQSRENSNRLARSLALAAWCLGWTASIAAAQTADIVLFNGKILTVDKDFSVQQALAIGHGQVLATGTSAAMKKLAGANAKLANTTTIVCVRMIRLPEKILIVRRPTVFQTSPYGLVHPLYLNLIDLKLTDLKLSHLPLTAPSHPEGCAPYQEVTFHLG